MSEERQIEEMARIICKPTSNRGDCEKCGFKKQCSKFDDATALYNADYHKQSYGEWEWFEEWSPSTTEHPRECDECGWRCGECKTALADTVGGYWDNPDEKPNLNFCPDCGAKMKGGDKE